MEPKQTGGKPIVKEYLFVNVNINEIFGSHCTVHRRIIDEKAQLGYRYVGYVPTDISDYGKIREMDLVFERDSDTE